MYTRFEEKENGLLITLDALDKESLQYLQDRRAKIPYDAFWWELNERAFCNGYSEVLPEHIGALTSAPIISDTMFMADDLKQQDCDNAKVWWFPEYETRDYIEELLTKGEVFFQKA